MTEKDDIVFIEHILDSIEAIEKFSKGITKDQLISNRMKRSAIVREIEIIGEAMKNVSKETRDKYKDVQWKEFVGARDKMIHHYFGIDFDIILNIVKEDLPVLKKQIQNIKENLE